MRKIASLVICAMVAIASGTMTVMADKRSVASGWNNENIEWFDFEGGVAKAAHSGKNIFVLVHTTWCPYCKKYKKVFQDPRVVSQSANFVMIMVDRDIEPKLNDRLGPPGEGFVPRTLFFNSKMKLISGAASKDSSYPHLINYDGPDELLAVMQKANANKKK